MDEEAIRIRLEGALERVEDATVQLERARALLNGDWRHRFGMELTLLERVRSGDAEAEATAVRIGAVAEKEAWPARSAPARALERYRAARQQLHAGLEQELGKPGKYGFDALLEWVIREALPPAGTPLMSARVMRFDESALVPAMIVLGVALPCISAISTTGGGICVAVAVTLGLLLTLPWLLSGSAVVMFADRVRHQSRFGSKELRHQPNLLTAQTIAKNGEQQTHLFVPHWKPLRTERSGAEELQALSSLFGRPPFEPPFLPMPDGVCVAASRPALPPERYSLQGALWIGAEGALFIHDGAASYDAATGEPGRGPNAKARPLGLALSALGSERSGPIVERLIAAGRAERLDPRTLELAKVDSTSLVIGQIRGHFERSERERVATWLAKKRG